METANKSALLEFLGGVNLLEPLPTIFSLVIQPIVLC